MKCFELKFFSNRIDQIIRFQNFSKRVENVIDHKFCVEEFVSWKNNIKSSNNNVENQNLLNEFFDHQIFVESLLIKFEKKIYLRIVRNQKSNFKKYFFICVKFISSITIEKNYLIAVCCMKNSALKIMTKILNDVKWKNKKLVWIFRKFVETCSNWRISCVRMSIFWWIIDNFRYIDMKICFNIKWQNHVDENSRVQKMHFFLFRFRDISELFFTLHRNVCTLNNKQWYLSATSIVQCK